MLADLPIKDFLDKTASGSPVPGGGSIAALSGASAAGLIEMVANLSIGKGKNKTFKDMMKKIATKAHNFKDKLVLDIDKDADAYNQVVEAYKLPKTSHEEKMKRDEAIQHALKYAALVPFGVAETACQLMDPAQTVAEKGNQNAITDAAVAAIQARSAVQGALYNVKINLAAIEDEDFIKKIYKQIKRLEDEAINKEHNILSKIKI